MMYAVTVLMSLEKKGTLITYEIKRRQILTKNCPSIFEVWLCFLKVHCIPVQSSLTATQSQKNNPAFSSYSVLFISYHFYCLSSYQAHKILGKSDHCTNTLYNEFFFCVLKRSVKKHLCYDPNLNLFCLKNKAKRPSLVYCLCSIV